MAAVGSFLSLLRPNASVYLALVQQAARHGCQNPYKRLGTVAQNANTLFIQSACRKQVRQVRQLLLTVPFCHVHRLNCQHSGCFSLLFFASLGDHFR